LYKNTYIENKESKSAFANRIIKTNTKDLYPEILSHIKEKSCLVVAPHPDDEIIGCGATLAKLKRDDVKYITLYMTYGENSLRGNEAKYVSECIGVENSIFVGGIDGELKLTGSSIQGLKKLLQEEISVIFLPSIYESHPDHIYTTRVFSKLISDMEDIMILCYEVWCPMLNNGIIEVDRETYQQKLFALDKYKSQISIYPLHQLCCDINIARTKDTNIKYAEAFYMCDTVELRKLIRRYDILKNKM